MILQRGTQPECSRIRQRMVAHALTAFFAPIVSFHEQVLGANSYINKATTAQAIVHGYEMLELIRAYYAPVQVLPFDQAAAGTFNALRAQRVRIGTMDLRIAAIALSRGMVVLTRNTSDFAQVPGLSVEDWTS